MQLTFTGNGQGGLVLVVPLPSVSVLALFLSVAVSLDGDGRYTTTPRFGRNGGKTANTRTHTQSLRNSHHTACVHETGRSSPKKKTKKTGQVKLKLGFLYYRLCCCQRFVFVAGFFEKKEKTSVRWRQPFTRADGSSRFFLLLISLPLRSPLSLLLPVLRSLLTFSEFI